MYISNMISNHGNKVKDQFVITTDNSDAYFQSYTSIIARRIDATDQVELDVNKWDYSKTTSKYLARFLGVPNKEIKQKVANGEYPLVDLNARPFNQSTTPTELTEKFKSSLTSWAFSLGSKKDTPLLSTQPTCNHDNQ